jgi:glyoxylase-like metal-dependent hydrolase (beta-lactamase superfamily II)
MTQSWLHPFIRLLRQQPSPTGAMSTLAPIRVVTPLSSVSITFLGTASAQPSSTRNHSALALRLGGDVWLFDCGEATQHQLQKSAVKLGKVNKVFITHTHGPLICCLLYEI